MRLIDADALKVILNKAEEECERDWFKGNEFREMIDITPTTEASPCDFCQYDGCGNPCIVCPATAKEDKDGKDDKR